MLESLSRPRLAEKAFATTIRLMGECRLGLAQGGLYLGQMALRGSVGWEAAVRGTEPYMSAIEIALPHPHHAALEVEQRKRKRRDPTVEIPALVEEALRGDDITALSVQRSQGPEGSKISSTFRSHLEETESLVVVPNCLQGGGAFGLNHRRIAPEMLLNADVGRWPGI